jgi:signal transduction histidine kinase
MGFFDQLFTLLAQPPGNFVYNLVVPIIVVGALQGVLSQWRSTGYPQALRMVMGLGFVLTSQVFLLLVGILMYQQIIPGQVFLPVLDRAVTIFSLVWIIWVWAFPEPFHLGDAAAEILSLVLLAGLLFGAITRASQAAEPGSFNLSTQELLWSFLGLLVMAAGAGFLYSRKPQGWGTGLTLVVLALLGFLFDLIAPMPGDYSGVVRFFALAGYPLLLTLPLRFPGGAESPKPRSVTAQKERHPEAPARPDPSADTASQALRERRRYSTDPKTLQSLLTLAAETDLSNISHYIARAVAQAMLADLCFLLYLGEDRDSIFIATGYDLIREETLEGGILNKEAVPMLASAVLRSRALRLPASTTSSDLKGLGDMLGLSNPGNLLNVPISSEKGTLGSVLLLSPYSNRVWSADDQTFLVNIASSFASIVERGRYIKSIETERERVRLSIEDAQAQVNRYQTANAELLLQLEALKRQANQISPKDIAGTEIEAKIISLEKENAALRTQAGDGGQQFENELRQALRETARLQNALAESNQKIFELQNRPAGASNLSGDQTEVIVSISQELRQPMASIIGYADLLLGESVGILTALQRKFIERIRTSTERIGSLIDDLIQITSLGTPNSVARLEMVDLNLIIDNAMAYTSSQLREKNITLRIDIPESMQPILTEREAVQQIMIHLLQNAGASSADEGIVTLRVRMQKEKDSDYALIQVTDTGGGIPSEDLPRVFSRLYRAENALIQGVGDTGVGLSIAKSLTEAQGGRIWVDTEMGSGSTFSVLLPLRRQPSDAQEG